MMWTATKTILVDFIPLGGRDEIRPEHKQGDLQRA